MIALFVAMFCIGFLMVALATICQGVVRMKIMMYGIEKFSYDGENIVCYNRKHDSTTVFHVGKDKSLKQVSGTICNPKGLLKMYAKHVK